MKTITSWLRLSLAAATILAGVSSAQATVLLDETFGYPAGNLKGNGRWGERGSGGTAPQVIEEQLTYNGYIHSGAGKAVQTTYTSGASSFITQDTIASISSGIVYLSLMYRPDGSQSQSQSDVIGLGTVGASNYVRLWHGKNSTINSGDPFGFGVTRASGTGTDIKWIPEDKNVAASATHFLVLKYDVTKKYVYLFVNPATGTAEEPAFDAADSTNTATITSVTALIMRQNASSKSNYTIGGVRLSTSWAEAVQGSVADNTPPHLIDNQSLTPQNGAADVEVVPTITATFSEPVQAGTNVADIKLICNDNSAEISITPSFSGATLTITPTAPLENGKTYHVEIPAGSVTDIAGNAFAGIGSADWVFTITASLSDAKELTALTLQGQRGESVYRSDSIFIAVPPTAKMDSLKVATLTVSDAATAAVGVNAVGVDSFVNTTGGDVTITVTAQDASTKNYTLRVSNAAATGNELLTFRINGSPNVNGVIRNDSVLVVMPASTTSLAALTAAFAVSPYAKVYAVVSGADSLQASGTTVNDFSATVIYKVVSEAGVPHEYKVAVSIAPKPKGLLLEENFLYPDGTKLSETATTGWTLDGTPDSTAKISPVKLDYVSYAPAGVSKSVQVSYPAGVTSAAYYKSLPAAISTDTVYLSCMVNTALAQSGNGYVGFSQGTSGQRARIWFKRNGASTNSTGVLVGVSRNSGTTASADYCTTDTLPYGSTALLVLRHIFVEGSDNDIVQVFINPIPGQPEPEPSVTADNASTGGDPALLDGIFIRANGSGALQYAIGGVRVATTWAEAVLYGEPAGAPIAETFTPAAGATDAPYTQNPEVTFNKAIKAGTGSIVIKKYADEAVIGTYDVTDDSKVSFNGKTLTIKAAPLPKGEKLYVEIPATAVLNNAGEAYAGTADKDTWTFTAPKSAAAEMTAYSIASPTTQGLVYSAIFAAGHDSATIVTNELLAQSDIDSATITVSQFATVAVKSNGYDTTTSEGVIVYEVTAEDGSAKEYRIAFVSTPASNIISYSIGDVVGKVSATTYIVTVSLPSATTDVTALTATFDISPGASATVGGVLQVSGVTANNYSDTVRYVITASDGTFTEWKVFAAPMPAGLLLKENFDYPEGILLKNAPGSGWVETANTIADASVLNYKESYMLTDTTRLTYPYYAAAIDDSSKSLRFVYPGFSSQGATTVKAVSKVDITAGTVYYSFMLNAASVTSNSGTEIVGFTSTPSSTAGQSRVYVKRVAAGNTTQFIIGVGKNHGSIANVTAWASAEQALACGQTHLVVLKYDFGTGYASLFVDPTVGSPEPAAPLLKDNTISSTSGEPVPVTAIRGIAIRENGTSQPVGLKIGGIRIATTWEDAVKMAESMAETGSDITAYSLKVGNEDVDGYFVPGTKDIEVTIGAEYEKTGLVATFELSPQATAYVDGTHQESGVTANDFDVDAVVYEVKPLKGSSSYWSVSVIKEGSQQNGIAKSRLRISVYPNPVLQDLYLQADKPVSRVEVFDVSGNMLYSRSNPGSVVSFAGLGSGVYFVRIVATDGSAITAKIAK